MEIISFNDKTYPAFQSKGNSSQFAIPFALHVCTGVGLDIGYSKQEWKLPGAIGVEPSIDFSHDAMNLPDGEFDYIFSSHMIEHFKGNIANLLDYWTSKIKTGGTLFLYLPSYEQEYWRFWNNRKHIHSLTPTIMRDYLRATNNYKYIFVSGVDLNSSFMCIAEKF
jgi:cyclopropane fatty-acyl-phospholipid synthase-like methyltransferase